ncbi:MAG: CDP-alcohol phosphatidyltransferase family protein [Flavobacteriales bacterium]|nr:CDP-alcohol phosphatidyltransferase family protein [Flavobacteriales bacterium]
MNNIFKKLYKNIPNIVSTLGVLPLVILFSDNGFLYLIPLIIYNNIMDDLDGILAIKLDAKSEFGARMDNVCDAVSHTIIVMFVGLHFGITCSIIGLIAVAAILIRSVARLDPSLTKSAGSPTNELIRHTLFALLLAELFNFDPTWPLIIIFLINTITMFLPFPMPYLIRSMTKSTFLILLVNVSLVLAWLVPYTAPVIAAVFIFSYFYSLIKVIISHKK